MTTDDETATAIRRARFTLVAGAVTGVLMMSILAGPAAFLANAMVAGRARYALTVGWMAVLSAPLLVVILRRTLQEQARTDAVVATITRNLTEAVAAGARAAADREQQSRGQEFESRLANALDMAEGEPEVLQVIERAFTSVLPQAPVELLLADNSHAHLRQMASASPTGTAPGCGVDSPDRCPAARRGQVQRFVDSEELDACPKLRDRPDGALSAVCVPVSIMGRTVGVIHATGAQGSGLADAALQETEVLAKLAGARIGLLRVMAETTLQASTDPLTGLLNRRSFEEKTSQLRRQGTLVCVAMADLDHFKDVNDTHGHETGDRALRLFARVLTESVRSEDLIGRHGGEEFVVALPGCTAQTARNVLAGFATRLQAAITVAGLPKFTVSFGVVDCGAREELPAALARADAALYQAKNDGRDRIVVHDARGSAAVAPAPVEYSAGVTVLRQSTDVLSR